MLRPLSLSSLFLHPHGGLVARHALFLEPQGLPQCSNLCEAGPGPGPAVDRAPARPGVDSPGLGPPAG
eukprot:761061-Hanusia_phi.AAC.7